jgi:hypothetical protein
LRRVGDWKRRVPAAFDQVEQRKLRRISAKISMTLFEIMGIAALMRDTVDRTWPGAGIWDSASIGHLNREG